MPTKQFCSAVQFFDFLPTRTLNFAGSPEAASAAVDKRIKEEAKKIIMPPLGVIFPASEPDPVTSFWLLLEGLNSILAIAPYTKTVSLTVDPHCTRYAKAFQAIADTRLREWQTGQLLDSYNAQLAEVPLTTDPLAQVSDTTIYTPGFTPQSSEDPDVEGNNLPYAETIERFILRETANLRTKIAKRGHPQTSLSDEVAEFYRDIVSLFVGAYVLAIRSLVTDTFNVGVDNEVASLLKEASEKIRLFTVGHYDPFILAN